MVSWPDIQSIQNLSDHQREKVAIALSRRWGILSGKPGSGKTFCAAQIIKACAEKYGFQNIAVAGPTGKSAVRITEVMQGYDIPIQATTIHSLLKVQSADDGWSFQHNERNPLPHMVLVIDEFSMVGTGLCASLFAAIGPNTLVLLLGDEFQLAPVEHGAPLRDLIDAGLPCGSLTEIQRNSGRIVRTCSEIVDARRFTPSPRLDLPEENLLHVEMDGADAQIRVLEGFLDGMRQAGNYDATWDVQVLCAVNKKSPLARKTLNKRLQALLNPEGLTAGKSPFRVGDKVVNLKNSWFKSVLPESDPVNADGRVYCANGEFGEIVSVEPNKLIVRLQAPSRTILVPRGTQRDDADDGDEAEGDAESNGQTATNTGCSFELAYACSVHKFQGSQVPIAIIMADSYPGAARVQSRNWIYTALSRAEKYCVVIGKKSVVDAMVGRDGLRRVTFLPELIGEERARIQRVRAAEAVHQWSDAEWEQVLEGIT